MTCADATIITSNRFYTRLFENREELRYLFSTLRGIDSMEKLLNSEELENHSHIVIKAIDEAISQLDNEKKVKKLLLDYGRLHTPMTKMRGDFFWVCGSNISFLL